MIARTYRVLVVDPDVEALSSLAASLRERGVRVSLANSIGMASERAKSAPFDAILASPRVARVPEGELSLQDALAIELPHLPPILVLTDIGPLAPDEVLRADVDKTIERVRAVAEDMPLDARVSAMPTAYTLPVTPLRPLLFVLAREKRSGTLSVSTRKGVGEVTVVDGEVIDAVYMHFEGTKALARLLLETDGKATFSPGHPAVMRRIDIQSDSLLGELDRQQAHVKRLQAEMGASPTTQFYTTNPDAPRDFGKTANAVLERLRAPTSLAELLDDLPYLDADIFAALIALVADGRVVTHEKSTVTELAGPDEIEMLRGVAARARKAGFVGAARIVFAATPSALLHFAQAALLLDGVELPEDSLPTVPVPHTMLKVHLGEAVELDLVALPLVSAYAPLWPMALAGAHVVVRMEEALVVALGIASDACEVPVTSGRALVPDLSVMTPSVAAELIKAALVRSA